MTAARNALAEYEALESAWLERCTRTPHPLEVEPLGIVLLVGITEPPLGAERLTGDLLVDVLGGIAAVVARWRAAAVRGGGGVAEVEVDELHALERRMDMVLELRRRERGGAS